MNSKIETLWNNLRPINNDTWEGFGKVVDPNEYRFDDYGAIIKWSEYGKQTDYGWNVDHVFPLSKGGDDNIINLELLHWTNNEAKGDDFPIIAYTTSRKSFSKSLENESKLRMRYRYSDSVIAELAQVYPAVRMYC